MVLIFSCWCFWCFRDSLDLIWIQSISLSTPRWNAQRARFRMSIISKSCPQFLKTWTASDISATSSLRMPIKWPDIFNCLLCFSDGTWWVMDVFWDLFYDFFSCLQFCMMKHSIPVIMILSGFARYFRWFSIRAPSRSNFSSVTSLSRISLCRFAQSLAASSLYSVWNAFESVVILRQMFVCMVDQDIVQSTFQLNYFHCAFVMFVPREETFWMSCANVVENLQLFSLWSSLGWIPVQVPMMSKMGFEKRFDKFNTLSNTINTTNISQFQWRYIDAWLNN